MSRDAPSGPPVHSTNWPGRLRTFLLDATIPKNRIDEALDTLRTDTEHEIRNVVLTLERMSKLGL
jgi:hypothetical protein